MYVKKSLKFEQVRHLQDHLIQSVWIKTGFRNSTDIYFCHFYRGHTSTLGASIAAQRKQLGRFLLQWEEATTLNNTNDTNEVHISGDMNLDSLNGKWLRPDYNLVTLSRLVETACNVSNYSQLVAVPTRFQYNRVREVTDYSCIDHVYANKKHRCSDIIVTPYGGSDHDIVGYTRFSKVPPEPSRTIRKRSYKDFILEDFLRDMGEVDWSEVYMCQDVDISTEILTRKIVDILNIHAPWVVFQKRKYYAPWITKETKELIKNRDDWKRISEENTKIGNVQAAAEAWSKFKQIRNKVNNRKKVEEVRFKSEKLSSTKDSPAQTWSTVKSFMNWKMSGGPPHQLSIGGRMVTKSSIIAKEMNKFFMNKVKAVRESITFLPNSFSKCREIMKTKRCRLTLNHVSVEKVNKLLKGLKNTKSIALDELDNFCIKAAADILDKPVHHIISMSIMQNKFPRSWKLSKGIPLHKNCAHLK